MQLKTRGRDRRPPYCQRFGSTGDVAFSQPIVFCLIDDKSCARHIRVHLPFEGDRILECNVMPDLPTTGDNRCDKRSYRPSSRIRQSSHVHRADTLAFRLPQIRPTACATRSVHSRSEKNRPPASRSKWGLLSEFPKSSFDKRCRAQPLSQLRPRRATARFEYRRPDWSTTWAT